MKTIAVYVPQNALIEAISPPYRLFKTANDMLQASGQAPLFKVEYVGLEPVITTNDGEYSLKINRLITEVSHADVIIIPALQMPLDKALENNAEAISWIQKMHAAGSEIASLCTGAFLLAATTLLEGKKCSTHWAFYEEFKTMFPNVTVVDGAVITDEGNIYSSGGANSLWNLLLYLLEKYTNRDFAIMMAKYFAIDIDRDSQNVFTIFKGQKNHDDNAILKAQEYIEKNYTDKVTIDILADQTHINRRSFERRFKKATHNTVIEYFQRVRIESAKRSFETSGKNVAEVMYDVGYTDTKAFRDVFKKITGLTPLAYKNKYAKGIRQ
jgi:transcriptional regulator GlxA family with amidase domain